MVSLYYGIYSAIKKNEITSSAATWIDLEITLSKEHQRQTSYDIAYMWSLKMIQMNLVTKQKLIHRYKKQTYGYQVEKQGDKLGG